MEKSLKSAGDSSCPTCNRSFGTDTECQEVIAVLKEEIERVPQKAKYIQKRLDEAIERQEKMEKLIGEKAACVTIREEVDEKNKQIDTTEETLQNLKAQIKTDEKC